MFILVGKSIAQDGNSMISWNVSISKSQHVLEIRKKMIKDLINDFNPFFSVEDGYKLNCANIKWSDRVEIKKLLSNTGLDVKCFLDSPYGLSYDIEEIEYLETL